MRIYIHDPSNTGVREEKYAFKRSDIALRVSSEDGTDKTYVLGYIHGEFKAVKQIGDSGGNREIKYTRVNPVTNRVSCFELIGLLDEIGLGEPIFPTASDFRRWNQRALSSQGLTEDVLKELE
ncbi:hypothetical protein GF386_04280 [Candidatus Pacearchaeota archaeon]|nr:hypothetical protein [Candidatus Pacearchaeota archaeon]MBD3283342.1 hypothetical protein [Candidatus Pacearchaeota archaeon]